MTYQQAAEYLEEHALSVLVMPDRTGFAIFRLTAERAHELVLRALAKGDTFEAAVENVQHVLEPGADTA